MSPPPFSPSFADNLISLFHTILFNCRAFKTFLESLPTKLQIGISLSVYVCVCSFLTFFSGEPFDYTKLDGGRGDGEANEEDITPRTTNNKNKNKKKKKKGDTLIVNLRYLRSKSAFKPFLTLPEDVIGVIASFSNTHLANLRQCDKSLGNLAILPKPICRYGHFGYDYRYPETGYSAWFYGISIPCTAEEAIQILRKVAYEIEDTDGRFYRFSDGRFYQTIPNPKPEIIALLDVVLEEVRAIGVDRYNALHKVLDNKRKTALRYILGGLWDGVEDEHGEYCDFGDSASWPRFIQCNHGQLDLAPHIVIETTPTTSITIEKCGGCNLRTSKFKQMRCNNKSEWKYGQPQRNEHGGDGGIDCYDRGLFCLSCYVKQVKTCSHEGCNWRGCVCNFLPCQGGGCSNFMCRRENGKAPGEGCMFHDGGGELDEDKEEEMPVTNKKGNYLVFCQSCASEDSVAWFDPCWDDY